MRGLIEGHESAIVADYPPQIDYVPLKLAAIKLKLERVLPKKLFPKVKHKDQRGITWEEHSLIGRSCNAAHFGTKSFCRIK